MKERWDLNRRAVRLLCHLDRKYFLCTLFSSLTTAIAPYIPIYFSAKIIDALTAGAGGKTLALYAALTVGLTALIGLAGALLKMHADVGEAELDRLVDWQHAEKAMDLPYALIEDRKTALLRERIEMETQTGYNVYYYAVTAGGLVRYAVQIAADILPVPARPALRRGKTGAAGGRRADGRGQCSDRPPVRQTAQRVLCRMRGRQHPRRKAV